MTGTSVTNNNNLFHSFDIIMLMTASCFSNNYFRTIKQISDWKLWTQSNFLTKYEYLIKISEKCISAQFEILDVLRKIL